MNIYIGNLPYRTEESEVRSLFEEYGEVFSVKLIVDRNTGRKKGFGFVEMEDAGAEKAIAALDNQDYNGRNLRVNQAKKKEEPTRF